MNNLKEQIQIARDEREIGDANKALELFLKIDESKLEPDQRFYYIAELGLTYWHVKKFDEAKNTFEKLKALAEKHGNKSYEAVALRHLSRPEFNENDPDSAVECALEARKLAHSEKREDLVWFDHGVVTAMMFKGTSIEEIEKWFELEAEDLYNISRKTKDEIAKWVWTTGLLMDRAKVYDTKSDLYVALLIAEHFSLARRKEQIETLLKEFETK